jgi:glycerophosphoryl diester phosphodiesterase
VQYDAAGVAVTGVDIPQYDDKRGGKPPASLQDIAGYADAIGPWKRQILRDMKSATLLKTTLIEQAHAAGLSVHTYTFRNEPAMLAPQYRNDPLPEYRQFFEMGVDGVFSDFPDTALEARAALD